MSPQSESGKQRAGVLVIGSSTIDVTAYSDRSPHDGETIIGQTSTLVPGGKGANQAIAAARAGAPTRLVACLGNDAYRTSILSTLTADGIDVSHVQQSDGPTGLAHIRVSASGQNNIVMVPNVNAKLSRHSVEEAIRTSSHDCSVLLTQLEIPIDVAEFTLRAGAEAGLTVVLDPAPAAPLSDATWQHVDIVTPNETEAAELTGITVTDVATAASAGAWFIDRGVDSVIITRAADGVVLITKDRTREFLPCRAVTAIDTTAAGDSFAGYMAAALAQGSELDQAIALGMCSGTLAVTKPGASTSIPRRAEVEAHCAA